MKKSSDKKGASGNAAESKNPLQRLLSSTPVIVILSGIFFGGLCTLSLEPFNYPGLIWIAIWPIFYFAERFSQSVRSLFLTGCLFALFLCSFSFYWLLHLFGTFGGLNIFLALLIFIPYTVVLNLKIPFFLLFLGIAHRLKVRKYLPSMWFVAASLGLLTDYLSPQVFPWYWGNLGAHNLALAQVAEFTGVYGISFVTIAGCYGFYSLAKAIVDKYLKTKSISESVGSSFRECAWTDSPNNVFSRVALPLLMFGAILFGIVRVSQIHELQATLPKIRVAMIQPNSPLERAGENRVTDELILDIIENKIPSLIEKAAKSGPLGMIVLPESAVPYMTTQDSFVTRRLKYYSEPFAKLASGSAQKHNANIYLNEIYAELLTNKQNGLPRVGYYNSSALYSPDGQRRESYHKRTLLAFGEYIPGVSLLENTGLIGLVPEAVRYSRFERGASAHNLTYYLPFPAKPQQTTQTLVSPQKYATPSGKFLPLICYEVLIPEYVREFFNDENPGFMVNITQDGWYGKTVETYQHWGLGRIRSIELRRALVRSTNSGSSGFVDLTGEIVKPILGDAISDQESEAVQVWDVPINNGPKTVYAEYGNTWILGILLLLLVSALMKIGQKGRK